MMELRFFCGKILQKSFSKIKIFRIEPRFPFDIPLFRIHCRRNFAKSNFRVETRLLFDSKFIIFCRKNFCNNWDSSAVRFRRDFSKIKIFQLNDIFLSMIFSKHFVVSNSLQKFCKIKLSNRTMFIIPFNSSTLSIHSLSQKWYSDRIEIFLL